MSSISTLVIKKPESIINSKTLYEKTRYSIGWVSICLWIAIAIISAGSADMNSKITGVSITFKLRDVLIMVITTFTLARGISTGNPYLIYPWIFLSSWSMYKHQYRNLLSMLNIFNRVPEVSPLAWVAFGIDLLGMVTKACLIFRIAQLSINLWYQKKLKSETFGQ